MSRDWGPPSLELAEIQLGRQVRSASANATQDQLETRMLRRELVKTGKRQKKKREEKKSNDRKSILFGVLILFSIILLFHAKPCDSARLATDLGGGERQEGSIMKLVDTPREREDVEEGNTILLRCTVSNLQGTAQWSKNEAIIYDQYTPDYNDRDHYVMVGNGTIGDFSLELRNANLEDTAQYTCTIRPKKDDIRIPPLVAKTNVTVLPHQSLEASKKQAPQRSSDSKQAREALNLPELVHPAGSNNSPPGTHHKQQAAGFVTPQQHHYSNINAFAGPTISSHSVQSQPGPNALGSTQYRASSTPGPSGPLQLFILWPYLLLGLAALLFMANIYLICSLYRRHKRARAHQRHHAPANEGSLESGSNGGCSSSNLADENDSQARLKNLSR